MRTLVLKLLAVSSLFVCLALAPHAAYANYGALYVPAIAPDPPLDPFAEAGSPAAASARARSTSCCPPPTT